jgi:iron complex outermembrane receptor protein
MNRIRRAPILLLALVAPRFVLAQPLEEIVVTSERREATELTTAISMEVFSAADLAIDKLQTVDDLQNATPNFSVSFAGFAVQSVNIRGVGNSVSNPNIQPGVAVFQDGMLMSETVVIQQGFLDVETIEVLRGPQGTFVGQSSTGGAVRINSVRPDFDGISGFIEGRLGNYRDQRISGAINLPLTDNLSTRFAFDNDRRDSYYENAVIGGALPPFEVGPHPGNSENQNVRASMLWEPNDSLSVLGRIELNTNNADADAPYSPNPATYINPNDPDGIGEAPYVAFAEPSNDAFRLGYDLRDSQQKAVSNRYSLEVRKAFDSGMEFVTMFGYQYNDLRVIEDSDATRANASTFINNVGPDNDYYNLEFDLLSPEGDRFSWVLGASWYHRVTPVHLRVTDNLCGYSPATGIVTTCPPPGAIPLQAVLVTIETVQRHAGLFGQFTFDISDTLELEIGARNSWDNNIDTTDIFVGIFGPPPSDCADPAATAALPAQNTYLCINPSAGNNRAKFKDSTPTYKVGLNWTPGDNHFIYGFFARGYKSGGVNNFLAFEPELVDDIELGWKGEALDGRMQVHVGAFYMDYTKMQTQAFLVRLSTSGLLSDNNAIVNIGDSTIEGLEGSVNARFGNFGLNFSAGYTSSDLGGIRTVDERFLNPALDVGGGNFVPGCVDGEVPIPDAFGPGVPSCFDYFNSTAGVELSGSDNVYSPELSYNLNMDYAFQLRNGALLRPRIAFSHSDSSFSSLFQRDNYYRIDERDIMNVSVSYEREDWELQAFCNNCGDETYTSTVTPGDGARVIYGAPRTAGLRFRRDF